MSKKIISAILVMAMIVSMSATAILSSVGAAAETDYEADRATLKELLQKVVIYGPELEERTYILLEQMGIVTWNSDKGYYNEYHARDEFWSKYGDPDYFLFQGDGETLGQHFVLSNSGKTVPEKVQWVTELDDDYTTYLDLAKRNVSNIVEYAASAWYFGQDANNSIVDASFNEGRNAVVKNAIGFVNYIFSALAGEVTATVKPLGYDEYYDSNDYMKFFTCGYFYNQSIGFNPYYFIISDMDYWYDAQFWGGDALNQYPIRWYTFAEAREIAPDEVFAFEIALRELAMKQASSNGAGVLFWDFIEGDYAAFKKIVNDLVKKLIGEINFYFGEKAGYDANYKSYLKLRIVLDIYDKYIKDVYNNIYTASAASLLNDVVYAKRLVYYIEANPASLAVLALADFDALIDKIVAGIKAVAPRSEQLLSADNIAEGTELVRKAEAYLANFDWSGRDNTVYKEVWYNLYNAMNDLKDMIPAAAGEKVMIVRPEGYLKIKDVNGNEILSDRVAVEFAPNWFSYWKFSSLLKDALARFLSVLTASTLPDIQTSVAADPKAVVDEINHYAFLAGVVGKILTIKDGDIVAVDIYADPANYPEDPLDNILASTTYSFYLFDSVEARDTVPTTATSTILSFIKHRANDIDENRASLGDTEKRVGVTSLYELVVGYVRGNNTNEDVTRDNFTTGEYDWAERTADGVMIWEKNETFFLNQDVAIDSVYNFVNTLLEVAKEVRDNFDASATYSFGFDWTIPDAVEVSDASATGYIGRIRSALKLLTADITKLVQIYAWVLFNVADVMDWDIDVTDISSSNTQRTTLVINGEDCFRDPANYPSGFFAKAKAAAEKLAKLIAENWKETPATKGAIVNAYNDFVKALKSYIFTEAGAEKFDSFVDDCNYVINHYFGDPSTYDYEQLVDKLTKGYGYWLYNKLYDSKNCYQYFQVKFEHAVEDLHEEENVYNLYYGGDPENWTGTSPLRANYLNALESLIANNNVSGYTRDFADKYQEIRRIAALVRGCIAGDEANGYTVEDNDLKDMPVWFAEKVLNELSATWASRSEYSVDKMNAYKSELAALLREADSKNVYAYKTNTDEAKTIWNAFVDAYSKAQYVALDARSPKADVDDAVAALKLAMANLEKIEAVDGAADKDTLAAKIEAAQALYARANVTTDTAAKENLELAIAEAKKALQWTITVLNSNDLETIIKNIDNAMNALSKSMYTGKDLKKDTKVLELQVVVDLYTEASYRKFANAVEAAYAMAEADTATESQMKNAYKAVADRFADLKLAPVEEPVVEPEVVYVEVPVEKASVVLEQAKAVYKEANDGYAKAVEGCTADTAAAYKATIDTLKADIDKEADDATLLSSIIALNLAKAALTVDVPDTFDD